MSEEIYQIKVSLLDTKPLIWRRIAVPGDITLYRLHKVIQLVMGWSDGHLHEFRSQDIVYGVPDPEFDTVDVINERRTKLHDVIEKPKRRFQYIYDFGDWWRHQLMVERVYPPKKGVRYPTCLGGERNCPPEDCGGPLGYADFLEAIADPEHPEHDDLLEWIGGEFDPDYFNLDNANFCIKTEFR